MNINNSNFNVKGEALNLNKANQISNEIAEVSDDKYNITVEQAKAIEQALTPEMKQALANCGSKINFVAVNDSFEKTGAIGEVGNLSESNETENSSTLAKKSNLANGCSGPGWDIFKRIAGTVARIVGWLVFPAGMAILSIVNLVRGLVNGRH